MGPGEDAENETLSAAEQVLSSINGFRKTGQYCDIKLVIDGVEFPAHKNILASSSVYFEGMFSGEFAEAHQESVTLKCIDVSIMENLLEYAYTTKTEISRDNVQLLLQAAQYFQVQRLLEDCCQFLKTKMNAENCLSTYELSELYSCTMLKEISKEFLLRNFPAVSNELEFLELEAEKVINIIEDDSLFVEKEEVVFDAVVRWFSYKEDQRKADLAKVLQYVRLTCLDIQFLHNRIRTVKALCESEPIRKLLDEVRWYHVLPNKRTELYTPYTRQRHCSPYMEVLVVSGTYKTKHNVILYVSENGAVKGTIPCGSVRYLCPAWGHKVYGLSRKDSKTMMYFNQTVNQWQTVKPQLKWPVPYIPPSLYNLNGDWYWFGNGTPNPIFCPERYESSADVWKPIAHLPEPIVKPMVVSLDGMIYVLGGITTADTPYDQIQCYDPNSDTWTRVTSLPPPRTKTRVCCAFNEQIYVFSVTGWPFYDRWMDMYDVSKNQWKRCADIPQLFCGDLRPYRYMVVLGGKIYLMITSSDGTFRHILVYSPSRDTWHKFPTIPDFRLRGIKGPLLIKR